MTKDLEKAKKDLEAVKKFVEGIELISAKTALDKINKNIAGIVKAHEEKKKKADESIKKLKEVPVRPRTGTRRVQSIPTTSVSPSLDLLRQPVFFLFDFLSISKVTGYSLSNGKTLTGGVYPNRRVEATQPAAIS